MWHRVAPALAHHYTVVCADLRGYGDSGKPPSDPAHAAYSKRAMAKDMVELMRDLGHRRFRLVGHDRGGRVAHRLCLDHPDAVSQVAVLDISPTRTMYANTDQAFATAYYHWFFLIQPYDLPERLIGADPGVLPAPQARRLGHRASRISTLVRWPSTSAASETRQRSTRPAKTIARRLRSISSTMQRARRRRSAVRCSCYGANAVSSIVSSSRWTTGERSRSTSAGVHCPADTTSRRRCRRRRCGN